MYSGLDCSAILFRPGDSWDAEVVAARRGPATWSRPVERVLQHDCRRSPIRRVPWRNIGHPRSGSPQSGGGYVKLTWLGGGGEKRRMSTVAPSASYSLTVRVAIENRPGMLGRVAMAIGDARRGIGAVGLVGA